MDQHLLQTGKVCIYESTDFFLKGSKLKYKKTHQDLYDNVIILPAF